MSLTAADVAEILRLLEQSSFDELTLEINGTKLSLKRGAAAGGSANAGAARDASAGGFAGAGAGSGAGAGTSAGGAAASGVGTGRGAAGTDARLAAYGAQSGSTSLNSTAPSASNPGLHQNNSPNQAATHAVPTRTSDPSLHDVPSPLLGTFYRSPKPGAPPFVEVGATVTEETIVAIIEVMKLMNTVRAGVRGTVTEILSADGTLVEYDQPILRIRKSAG